MCTHSPSTAASQRGNTVVASDVSVRGADQERRAVHPFHECFSRCCVPERGGCPRGMIARDDCFCTGMTHRFDLHARRIARRSRCTVARHTKSSPIRRNRPQSFYLSDCLDLYRKRCTVLEHDVRSACKRNRKVRARVTLSRNKWRWKWSAVFGQKVIERHRNDGRRL
jgi:hypothetical protein